MTGEAHAKIVIESETPQRAVDLVDKHSWSIGRGRNCDIVLSDPRISRQHAYIQKTHSGGHDLIDSGSKNASFVNDILVTAPRRLKDGDTIRFCNVVMRYANPLSADLTTASVSIAQDETVYTIAEQDEQLASVLVVDVRGYANLANRLNQNDLAQVMNRWFSEIGRIIEQHDGWVDKFMGDAAMAVWFHVDPDQLPHQVLNVLKATAEIAHFEPTLGRGEALEMPFRVAAGINTGLSLYGRAGDTGELTVMGDQVIRALRLEKITRQFDTDVAIGMNSVHIMQDAGIDTSAIPREEVTLKGFPEPEEVATGSYAQLDSVIDAAMSTRDQ